MENINGFILDLEALKNRSGRGEFHLANDDKGYIMERKKSELKSKADQIQ